VSFWAKNSYEDHIIHRNSGGGEYEYVFINVQQKIKLMSHLYEIIHRDGEDRFLLLLLAMLWCPNFGPAQVIIKARLLNHCINK
jgi:hypothetical protein